MIKVKSQNGITFLLALFKDSSLLIFLILSVSLHNISLLSQFSFTQDCLYWADVVIGSPYPRLGSEAREETRRPETRRQTVSCQ